MKKEYRNTGQLIKEFRKAKGLTQIRLSELVGVSYQQIQKYESGIDNISVERLKQIAKALNVPITQFFRTDREMVAEAPAPYGRISDDEQALLQLFRGIKDKKVKKAIFELLKSLTTG